MCLKEKIIWLHRIIPSILAMWILIILIIMSAQISLIKTDIKSIINRGEQTCITF